MSNTSIAEGRRDEKAEVNRGRSYLRDTRNELRDTKTSGFMNRTHHEQVICTVLFRGSQTPLKLPTQRSR